MSHIHSLDIPEGQAASRAEWMRFAIVHFGNNKRNHKTWGDWLAHAADCEICSYVDFNVSGVMDIAPDMKPEDSDSIAQAIQKFKAFERTVQPTL